MTTKFFRSALLILLFIAPAMLMAQKGTQKVKLSLTDNEFYIRNVGINKYLDIPGGPGKAQTSNGANVQLWDLDAGNDRKVKFIPAGNNYYQIRFQHANLELDVHGCFDGKLFCGTYKRDKGANIQAWSPGSHDVHKWRIEEVRPGQFKIVNKYSGKVLDAAGGKKENGTNLIQWNWHGGDNQLWELIDVKTGSRYQL